MNVTRDNDILSHFISQRKGRKMERGYYSRERYKIKYTKCAGIWNKKYGLNKWKSARHRDIKRRYSPMLLFSSVSAASSMPYTYPST